MGLDIWFVEDIRRALVAANEASAATAAVPASIDHDLDIDELARVLCAFRAGYSVALTTVVLAFGLSPDTFDLPSDTLAIPRTIDMAREMLE